MSFLTLSYLYFLAGTASLFWIARKRKIRNFLLLASSYVFYGYVHQWYLLLIGATTVLTYASTQALQRESANKKGIVTLNVAVNVGMLCFLKYVSFWSEGVAANLGRLGWHVSPDFLNIILPIGVSFFTLQAISYVADCAKGECAPRRNFIDVALFIAFFPKLISGPLERANHLFPQLEEEKAFDWRWIHSGALLIATGLMKKMVVADNLKIYVDQIYMQQQPYTLVFVAATILFSVQILADFSGYTDIARGSARFFGIDLVENFRNPYLAVSPSDFWRRWHISLSTWFRDYVYIPLGGSKTGSTGRFFLILLVTMLLSGAWHGSTLNYVLWGAYHALLLFAYSALGLSGKWTPSSRMAKAGAIAAMYVFSLVGWMFFRSADMTWLIDIFLQPMNLPAKQAAVSLMLLIYALIFCAGWILTSIMLKISRASWMESAVFWIHVVTILTLSSGGAGDFIYFQF